MADVTLERLAEGIRRANAKGDIEAVKKLGMAYRQMQGQGASVAAEANANASAASKRLQGKVADLPSQRPTMMDEVQSFGRGMIEGIPVAGPTLSDWRRGLDANIASMATGQDAGTLKAGYEAADQELAAKTGGARMAGNVTGAVASLAPLGATAVGGRLLGTTGTLGQRIGMGMASSAAISGADTLARGGDMQEAGASAGIGAAIGGALPMIGAGIRRLVSPVNSNAQKQVASALLEREGVQLTAGQATGSKGLMYREAELGGSAAEDFIERQGEQFTSAVLRRVGINSPRATPDVIDAGFSAIGQQFDDVAARNRILPSNDLYNDLSTAWRDYSGVVSQSNRAPIVENMVRDIIAEARTGQISGEFYKALRSRIERAARGTRDPELAGALRDVRGALDDAMERTIGQTNPADLGAWQEVRGLYRNMLVVEDAIGRAGEKAADGLITPSALKSAAMRKGKRAFVRGQSEFTELANAGVSTMTPLPNSGTAGRLNAKLPLPLGAATGAGIGGTVAGIPGAAVGGLVGAAAPWAVGRAMLSGPGRAYLGNQIASGPAGRAALPPVVAALLAQRELVAP